MTVYQPERWREIVSTRSAHGMRRLLSKEFVIKLYEIIHHESIKKQLTILQPGSSEVNNTETHS